MSSGCSKADNNNTNYCKYSWPVQSVLTVVRRAFQHPLEIRCHIFWLLTHSDNEEEEDALLCHTSAVISRVTLP